MTDVVEDPAGTARVTKIAGLAIAGKTGTAQTSGGKDTHAWFIGYTASDKARLSFGIFLEHGGGSYNAARLAHDLLLRLQQESIL